MRDFGSRPLLIENSYQVVKQTWLTRKPSPLARPIATLSTFAITSGSLVYLFNFGGFGDKMPASPRAVFEHGEIWRLWTTLFAHADIGHLASNSLLFFILGFFLNGYFGSLVFPLAALAFGGLTNLIVLRTYEPEIYLIGASGVVYWMGGVWLVLYFILSRQKNLAQRTLRTLGVAILIFMPAQTFEPHISYRTHFIGFVLGIGFGCIHYFKNRRRYLAAEIRETIIDEVDPEDDLPPPEGLRPSH